MNYCVTQLYKIQKANREKELHVREHPSASALQREKHAGSRPIPATIDTWC